MKGEYLLFNLIIIAFPVISGMVYKKASIKFSMIIEFLKKSWLPALLFIIYDILATGLFWDFNDKYILGIKFFKLPIEEYLFFFTVPFSCLFLWGHLKSKIKDSIIFKEIPIYVFATGIILSIFALVRGYIYTYTMIALLLLLIYIDVYSFKTLLIKKRSFLIFISIVIILTLAFNGYLTARPVVIYTNDYRTNISIFTIPIEDFLFGINLIYLNLLAQIGNINQTVSRKKSS